MAERMNQNTEAGMPGQNGLPRHIAIVLDGNGRWAKKRGLPRKAGHAAGAETFRRIATYCRDLGVEYLTAYAFSTENWSRSRDEVDALMSLLEKYVDEAIETMEKNRVRLRFLGDTTALSPKLQALLAKTEQLSRQFDGVTCSLCLNYGGRDEIVRAARRYAEDYKATGKGLTEESFDGYLYTAGMPAPDLMIRTGGEMRLSNFLLWECAYSELYFTDTLWPDFDQKELDKALAEYRRRDRRFGGVKE
jgi:undecaprenyl diphosphate synthase